MIPLKGEGKQVRCFSHQAEHPNAVSKWVPVNLPNLGDTIVFDVETCEIMNNNDVEFLIDKLINAVRGIIITDQVVVEEVSDSDSVSDSVADPGSPHESENSENTQDLPKLQDLSLH